jgi:hypothetical protein
MNWIKIESQADADALLDLFGGFHDGCIREAHLWTEHFVAQNLSMSCAGNLDNNIRFLIQRQFKNPSAIELVFEQVTRFNLVPSPDNYDSVIYDATLLVHEGIIYWSPEEDWTPNAPDRDNTTWISSNILRWREVDWLGEELRYGPNKEK